MGRCECSIKPRPPPLRHPTAPPLVCGCGTAGFSHGKKKGPRRGGPRGAAWSPWGSMGTPPPPPPAEPRGPVAGGAKESGRRKGGGTWEEALWGGGECVGAFKNDAASISIFYFGQKAYLITEGKKINFQRQKTNH